MVGCPLLDEPARSSSPRRAQGSSGWERRWEEAVPSGASGWSAASGAPTLSEPPFPHFPGRLDWAGLSDPSLLKPEPASCPHPGQLQPEASVPGPWQHPALLPVVRSRLEPQGAGKVPALVSGLCSRGGQGGGGSERSKFCRNWDQPARVSPWGCKATWNQVAPGGQDRKPRTESGKAPRTQGHLTTGASSEVTTDIR